MSVCFGVGFVKIAVPVNSDAEVLCRQRLRCNPTYHKKPVICGLSTLGGLLMHPPKTLSSLPQRATQSTTYGHPNAKSGDHRPGQLSFSLWRIRQRRWALRAERAVGAESPATLASLKN